MYSTEPCVLFLGTPGLLLSAGKTVELDTRTPHWFGATRSGPVEYLRLFGDKANTPTSAPPRTTVKHSQRVFRWKLQHIIFTTLDILIYL